MEKGPGKGEPGRIIAGLEGQREGGGGLEGGRRADLWRERSESERAKHLQLGERGDLDRRAEGQGQPRAGPAGRGCR